MVAGLRWRHADLGAPGNPGLGAEVFDSDGRTLYYDDESAARMALLDAEFRAFDGLDEDDAARWGFDLEEVERPRGDNDEDLLPQMVAKVP